MNSKFSIDERYAFGLDGTPPPDPDYTTFYTLKEQAIIDQLTSPQLNYLFDPVPNNSSDKWWNLKSAHYEYEYDNFGFRNIPELATIERLTPRLWKESYVCIGCSWTFGTGVPGRNTWPVFLQEQIGTRCLNLGVGGAGIETTYRILNAWIKHFGCKPKGVLILGWFTPRLEIAETDRDAYTRYTVGGPDSPKKVAAELINEGNTHTVYTTFRKKFAELKEEYDLDVYRINPSVISQSSYCKPTSADLKFFSGKATKFLQLKGFGYDLSHPGPAPYRHIANIFKIMIETGDKFLI